jgi:hypothetical protein
VRFVLDDALGADGDVVHFDSLDVDAFRVHVHVRGEFIVAREARMMAQSGFFTLVEGVGRKEEAARQRRVTALSTARVSLLYRDERFTIDALFFLDTEAVKVALLTIGNLVDVVLVMRVLRFGRSRLPTEVA